MTWDIRNHSPLLPFVAADRGEARFTIDIPTSGSLPKIAETLAGVAEVDITPPPGMPKAGYSSLAHDGSGFRTRLRARVLHLREGTSSVAIIFADLLSGSRVVQHLVARGVAEVTDIPADGIFMGATHTHAGPGQYFGSDFYNRFAANHPGFDPAWTQFLVEQITSAVIEAYQNRRPATVAIGTTQVWGSTRNRSLKAHIRAGESTVSDSADQRRFQAINPDLHVIRVDAAPEPPTAKSGAGKRPRRKKAKPLGAFVIFSIHGTGVSEHESDYNADVWAYVCGELANRAESQTKTRPIVGAMQCTHGDIAPAVRPKLAVYDEAERVGREIGAKAAELWQSLETAASTDIGLAIGLREIDLDTNPSIGGVTLPAPAAGAALVAGADENTTPLIHRIPPFRAGSPKPHRESDPHGSKWILASRALQPLIAPGASFPRILSVHVLRIDGTTLVGMPFEITCAAGRRIAQTVEKALPNAEHGQRVIVSSVANGYVGYCTTPEEYERQFYEGGHTIYGPNTVGFLAQHASEVAAGLSSEGGNHPPESMSEASFSLKAHRYLARPDGVKVERKFLNPPTFHMPTTRQSAYWETRWRDVSPGDLHWHEPLVTIQSRDGDDEPWRTAACGDGTPASDSGWHLEIRHDGRANSDGHRYMLRWYNPEHRGGRHYRVVLHQNAGQPELISPPFD
ncbi:MAG: neutral/alkaline non-lysosomal ceramidase N-terminal domain-containing protein [Candidatus Nanopelagicales bacterium]|nr:neutral/alkaline non-lysosomal ceramidase N-terminal domain-containing protein [Candidatus Nanopelagicales bacterium]MDZ4249747.1 neutral/alkaline non-lysosomal ceramidase N-terminal domain-containing protein [Candidatus Nanopelagicales bacterium]